MKCSELKANKNFLELQSQLEGTENRINVARDRYNDEVNKYDTKNYIFALMFFQIHLTVLVLFHLRCILE